MLVRIFSAIFVCFVSLFTLPVFAEYSEKDFYPSNQNYIPTSERDLKFHDANWFTLHPRLTFWGMAGSEFSAEAQGMLPIYSDYNQVFYTAAEGTGVFSDSRYMVGLGLGYRRIVGDRLWGGYLFGDYIRTDDKNSFIVANPGFESLGKVWDFDANLYIPLGKQKKIRSDWSDEFGIYDNIEFRNDHEQWNTMSTLIEEISTGFDAEVGRVVPGLRDLKAFLGGYHFMSSDLGSVSGGSLRLTYDINRYTGLEFVDTYDNVEKNRIFLGFKIGFGGYSDKEKEDFGLHTRLLDPVMHNLVTIAGTTMVPVRQGVTTGTEKFLQHDNVWFFKTGGGDFGDGSFSDPFSLRQDHLDGVTGASPWVYFAGGTYSLSGLSARAISGRMEIPNGWRVYGKTNTTYKIPALNNDRPLFNGGIDVEAGSATTYLESIRIENDVADTVTDIGDNAALYAKDVDDLEVKDVDVINDTTSSGVDVYVLGAYLESSKLSFIGGANAFKGLNKDGVFGVGVFAFSGSEVDFIAGTNHLVGNNLNAPIFGVGSGLYVNDATVNFIGGNNTLTGEDKDAASSSIGAGIFILEKGMINFNGGTNMLVGNADATGTTGELGAGIVAQVDSAIVINDGQNTFKGSAKGENDIQGYGIYVVDSSASVTGGINSFDGLATAIDGAGTDEALGFGIGIYGTDLSFSGGNNTLYGKADGDGETSKGYGIFAAIFSSVDFTGGNNVVDGVTAGGGSSTNNAFGVYLETSSSLNFDGGTNEVTGTANSDIYSHASYGILAGDESKVDFKAGTNTVTGVASGGNTGRGNGIFTDHSDVEFTGGTNNIVAKADGSGNNSAYAFYMLWVGGGGAAGPSTVTFTGGTNTILAETTNGTSNVSFGFFVGGDSIVNFNNDQNGAVTIKVGGDGTTGISASGTGPLQIGGIDVDGSSLGDFEDDGLIIFERLSGTSGKKIDWTSVADEPW